MTFQLTASELIADQVIETVTARLPSLVEPVFNLLPSRRKKLKGDQGKQRDLFSCKEREIVTTDATFVIHADLHHGGICINTGREFDVLDLGHAKKIAYALLSACKDYQRAQARAAKAVR